MRLIARGLYEIGVWVPTFPIVNKRFPMTSPHQIRRQHENSINWQWTRFLQSHIGVAYGDSVRSPATFPTPDSVRWHQDCGGSDYYLIVWASILPTLVETDDTHHPIELQSFRVYAMRNLFYRHKTPPYDPKLVPRWFARAYIHESHKALPY